jgi:hypothetical protein
MRGFGDEYPEAPWLHGVAARRELLEAGVGERAIEHRLERPAVAQRRRGRVPPALHRP